MNVALAGLTVREETALRMLVGITLPHFECGAMPAGSLVPLPPADLYVLDLAGRGLANWTQEAQEKLLQSLNGAPAVLVAPAFDRSWQALDAGSRKSHPLVMLHKPYGIEDMRAALLKAAPPKPVRPEPVAPPVPVSVRRAEAQAVWVLAVPRASPKPPAPVQTPVHIAPLSVAEFQSRLGGLPANAPKAFLGKLAEALALQRPFEVRVTFLHRLIFCPDAQWAASNTALSVLQGLCQSDALAADISIDAIDSQDALARAQRLDIPVQSLESFLGTLMHDRLGALR